MVLRIGKKRHLTLGLLAVSRPVGMLTDEQLHGVYYHSDAIAAVLMGSWKQPTEGY